jgi:hypothetical protein
MKTNNAHTIEMNLNQGVAYLLQNKILITAFAVICFAIIWHKEIVQAVEFIEELV